MSGIQIEIKEENTENVASRRSTDSFDDSYLANSFIDTSFDSDTYVAKQVDYQENYVLADLKKIADYYEIQTRKLRKDELIQEIVLYESDPTHSALYLKRLQAWYWLKEFKNDPKLKQYILF